MSATTDVLHAATRPTARGLTRLPDGRHMIEMQGGTALVRELAAALDEPTCEHCGEQWYADTAVWVVVEVDADGLPFEVRPSDYGYCGTGCARRDGAL